MIGWKGIYAILASVIYSILIGLFINYTNEIFKDSCTIEKPCIRFCSKEESIENLKNNFTKANLNRFIEKEDFEVLQGEPRCRERMIIKEAENGRYYFAPVINQIITLKRYKIIQKLNNL
jgi:hypothetical protein